jgi:hypothetical protein
MDFACEPTTGACVAAARIETEDCNGITDGRACGDDGEQISCTSCDYNDVCDTEASQSCKFAHEKCQGDVCARQPDETRNLACSRSGPTNPQDACAPPTMSDCGLCLNPLNVCDAENGQQECTVTHHGCVSGACGSMLGGTGLQSCTPGNQDGKDCGLCPLGTNGSVFCFGGACQSVCVDECTPFC